MQYAYPYLGRSLTLLSVSRDAANAMTPVRSLALLLALLLTPFVLCSGMGSATVSRTAATTVIINPTFGPPTTTMLVAGSGFDPYAEVDIYFDSADLAMVTTNGTGSFGGGSLRGGIPVQVPASALPGTHLVRAVEPLGQKAAQTAFLVRTDWARFRFSLDHIGVNPYENVLSLTTIGSMGLAWTYRTNGYVDPSPTVANGMVYAASWDGNLYALSATNGAFVWKYVIGSGAADSSPAVANGVVYVGSPDHNVYALNASNGSLLWRYTTGSLVKSSPAVANGIVYVGSFDGNLYALNASTGVFLWKYTTGQDIWSSPAVANGIVYVGSGDGNLYALSASTGAFLWKYTTGNWIDSSPAVANGTVYFGSGDYNVYALNASTGTLRWKYMTGNFISSSAAVAAGVVYIGSRDGNLYALSASMGTLLWKYTTGGGIVSSPAVANGVVYVGSGDRNLYALNAGTGRVLWQYTTGSLVDASPAVANGVVYVGSWDGNLYAFALVGGPSAKSFGSPEHSNQNLLYSSWILRPGVTVTGVARTAQDALRETGALPADLRGR